MSTIINTWLPEAVRRLKEAGIGTARLDALVLLENVFGKDRAYLLAQPELELSAVQAAKLDKLLGRRAKHIPLSHILGRTEFYGRSFVITPAVLEPRPESEAMIDELMKLPGLPSNPYLADVGSGSGALGITAKLELPEARVDLIDIDPKALAVAKTNVDKFTLNISVIKSDLLGDTKAGYDVLLCNLPYVPDDYQINRAATHEPRLAIFGGPDGLDVYRQLFEQLRNRSQQPLYILTESLPPQHDELAVIAASAGYELVKENDFIQVFGRTHKRA